MRPSTDCSVNTGNKAAMMIRIAYKVGTPHVHRRAHHQLQHFAPVAGVFVAQRMNDILDQHHSAVDQDPEVDRAHRDQVGRQTKGIEAEKGHQQRQRYDHGHHHRAHDAAQKQPDHSDHKNESGQEVFMHRRERQPDEVGAVVDIHHAHALGQDRFVQFPHLGMNALQHPRRVLAAPHPHETFDRFLFKAETYRSPPRRIRLHYGGNIAYRYGSPVLAPEKDAA